MWYVGSERNDKIIGFPILFKLADNVRQIADFLAQFEMSCKSKLATLNDSITSLERKVEFLEARVTKGETLN